MQNINDNTVTDLPVIEQFVTKGLNPIDAQSIVFMLIAIQNDLIKIPFILDETDIVGGNFPVLPESKKAWLYLDTGTYEAVVIGGNDKWRRLYDGTTYDPATPIP